MEKEGQIFIRNQESEELMLQKIKQEFSREIPEEYFELAKTPSIPPNAPSYGWSIGKLFEDKKLQDELAEANFQITKEAEDGQLTEQGLFIKNKLNNETLIDLCCGEQKFISRMAKAFGAKRYIGIDKDIVENASEKDSFEEYTIKDDLLLFLAKLPDNYGTFFMAGADDDSGEWYFDGDSNDVLPSKYMDAVLKEIYRTTKKGSLFIGGCNNTISPPEDFGFKQVSFGENDSYIGTYLKE